MADDYASHALSQRAAFEATHPTALAAAEGFADEPVLRVADLGAADGVNSHGLIRDLIAERAGRQLVYALVDLPTSAWRVAAEHLRREFADGIERGEVAVIPAPGENVAGAADVGTGLHFASPEAHAEACRRALEEGPPPTTVVSLAGIPLHRSPCLDDGSVHMAVTGTALHWIAESAALASTGSIFPGYRDHRDEAERRAWDEAATRQWEQLLEMRGLELATGGRLVAAVPASPAGGADRTGPYAEIISDINGLLAAWHGAGRIGADTVAAAVVPVWMRTLDEIRAPFAANGGRFAGLLLETAELFHLDNPYWDDDADVFAHRYARSVAAWGEPLLLRAFAREGDDRAAPLFAEFLQELEHRVKDDPDRYRRDYIEALVICRRLDDGRN